MGGSHAGFVKNPTTFLRCEEVEKGEKTRKEIEEKLTEAMLRECVKCGYKFYKEEGCNKMTCKCGAKMCYLCKKEVKDYSHFYCPLFSDNKRIHQMELVKVAEEAKLKLVEENILLTVDPTQGIVMPSGSGVNTDDVRAMLFQRWSYDPEAYEVEEVKGVEITARRGKKTVGVFSTCMAISYIYTAMIIMQHFSYCTIMSICLFCRVL